MTPRKLSKTKSVIGTSLFTSVTINGKNVDITSRKDSVFMRASRSFQMKTIEFFLAKLKCHFRGTKSLIFLFEHNLFLKSLHHQKYAGWDAVEREDMGIPTN